MRFGPLRINDLITFYFEGKKEEKNGNFFCDWIKKNENGIFFCHFKKEKKKRNFFDSAIE